MYILVLDPPWFDPLLCLFLHVFVPLNRETIGFILPVYELQLTATNWWSTCQYHQTVAARTIPQDKAVIQFDLTVIENLSHR